MNNRENIHASYLGFPVKTQVRDSKRPDRGSVVAVMADTNIYTMLGHNKRTMKRHIRYTILVMFQSALYTSGREIMKLSCIKVIRLQD